MATNKWVPVVLVAVVIIAAVATRHTVVASGSSAGIFIVNNWTGSARVCHPGGCRNLEDKSR